MMISGRHRSRGESKYCFLHLGSFFKSIYMSVLSACVSVHHMDAAPEDIRRGCQVGFQMVVNHHVGTEFELQSLGRTTGALNS